MTTARDWKRLGPRVRSARKRRGFTTGRQFAEHLKISAKTLGKLERGEQVGEETLALVEPELDWAPGSMEAVLDRKGHATMLPGFELREDEGENHARSMAYQQILDGIDQLKDLAEGDDASASSYILVLNDLTLGVGVLQRLGDMSLRRYVIELAGRYRKELPPDDGEG